MHQSRVYGVLFGTFVSREIRWQDSELVDRNSSRASFAIYTLKREKLLKSQDLELKLILEAADIGIWTYHLPKDEGYRSPHIAKFLGKTSQILNFP